MSRMQSFVTDHQEQSQRLQQEMTKRLQEKEQTIKAQREQVSTDWRSHSCQSRVVMFREDVGRKVSACSGYPVLATWAQMGVTVHCTGPVSLWKCALGCSTCMNTYFNLLIYKSHNNVRDSFNYGSNETFGTWALFDRFQSTSATERPLGEDIYAWS